MQLPMEEQADQCAVDTGLCPKSTPAIGTVTMCFSWRLELLMRGLQLQGSANSGSEVCEEGALLDPGSFKADCSPREDPDEGICPPVPAFRLSRSRWSAGSEGPWGVSAVSIPFPGRLGGPAGATGETQQHGAT